MGNAISESKQWVGVDLHLHRSVVGRIDDRGELIEWVRIDNDPKALVKEVRKAGRRAPVAVEATYGWYWAVDALQAAKFDVHLAHPYGMKKMRNTKRVKTDQADAYELANLLRLGSLPEAWIAPVELRELRELVRHRQRLVKASTSVKSGIRGLLAKHGIRLEVSHLEGPTGLTLLNTVELPALSATRLASQQRLMLLLANEIDAVVTELDKRLKSHVGYRNLLKIKGIGPTLAAVFVVEIGDINRFPTARALTCWAGLTPRHYESDKTVRRGQISKEGCALVRWAAVEAIQRPCEPTVAAVKERILARRGRPARNIAKVAAGRRMLEVVYYVLRDGHARCLDTHDSSTEEPAA
ncbi:MAG: IS110 family transposase [Actinomycetota bacterium]|nr:IS110 family transposase [Actinomycetota bacterium]